MKTLNVTKNINIIESLKCTALYKIADIYRYQGADGEINDKSDSISDLIIILYLLAEKMGWSYEEIDKNVMTRLKNAIKSEESEWREELKLLLRYFE